MTGPNRAEQVRQAVFWGAVAAEATARARELSAGLEAQARAELERDGTAPNWVIPGLGTIPLALSADRVDVVDPDAYLAWVAQRYPDNVEVLRRVRPAFDEWLRKEAAKRGAPCDDEGTIIPGLAFRPGGTPRGIQLRPNAAAKAGAAAAAAAYLDAMPLPIEPTG